ncbi:MAG: hypothetical protein H6677_06160 [Candidatus Obscuribacterales bacterium]|nr:hypothetical protein [Candidatus Obscuribacterales bacterium]
MSDGRETSVSREVQLSYQDGTKVTQGPDTGGLKFEKDGKELVLNGDIDIDRNGKPVVKLDNPADYKKLEEFFGDGKADMPVSQQLKFDDGSTLARGSKDGELTYTDKNGNKSTLQGTLTFDENGHAVTNIKEGSANEALLQKIEAGGKTELKFDTNGSFTDVSYKAVDTVAVKQSNGQGSANQPVVQYTDGAKFSTNPETGALQYTDKAGNVTNLDGKIEIDAQGNAKVVLNSEKGLTDEVRATLNHEGPGDSATGVTLGADGSRLVNHPTEQGKMVHISADGTETIIDGNIKFNADGTSQVNLSKPDAVSQDILNSIKGSGTVSSTYNNVDLSKFNAPPSGGNAVPGAGDSKKGGVFGAVDTVVPAKPAETPVVAPVNAKPPVQVPVGADSNPRISTDSSTYVKPDSRADDDRSTTGNAILDGHDDARVSTGPKAEDVNIGAKVDATRRDSETGAVERRDSAERPVEERFEANRAVHEQQQAQREIEAQRREEIAKDTRLQEALKQHDGSKEANARVQEAARDAQQKADQRIEAERKQQETELKQRQERLEQDKARDEAQRKQEEQRVKEQEERIKQEQERLKEQQRLEQEEAKQREIEAQQKRIEQMEADLKQQKEQLQATEKRLQETEAKLKETNSQLEKLQGAGTKDGAQEATLDGKAAPTDSKVVTAESGSGTNQFKQVTEVDPATGAVTTKLVPVEGTGTDAASLKNVDNSALVDHINQSGDGNSKLEQAIKSGDVKLVQALENGDTKLVNAIVNKDGKLEVALESGNVPLAQALQSGQVHVAQAIEQSGGNLQVVNAVKDGKFELARAIQSGDTAKVEAIQTGATVGDRAAVTAGDKGSVTAGDKTSLDRSVTDAGAAATKLDTAIASGDVKTQPINAETAKSADTAKAIESGNAVVVKELPDGSHQAIKTTVDSNGNVQVEVDGSKMSLEQAAGSHNLKLATGDQQTLRSIGDTSGKLAQSERDQAGAATAGAVTDTAGKPAVVVDAGHQPVNSDLARSTVPDTGDSKGQSTVKSMPDGQPVKTTEGKVGSAEAPAAKEDGSSATTAKTGTGTGSGTPAKEPAANGNNAGNNGKDGSTVTNDPDPSKAAAAQAGANQDTSGKVTPADPASAKVGSSDPVLNRQGTPDPGASNGTTVVKTGAANEPANSTVGKVDNGQGANTGANQTANTGTNQPANNGS